MTGIEQRLHKLETATTPKGYRVFRQSLDNADQFHEDEQNYTRAQIDVLGRQGWKCIMLEFTHDWRGDAAI